MGEKTIEQLIEIDNHPWPPVSLTPDESQRLEEYRRGLPEWCPQSALHHLWAFADAIHGAGGRLYLGRPRKPEDPNSQPWSLAAFLIALDRDRADISAVIKGYPWQADRLRRWMQDVECLGQERERGIPLEHLGGFYNTLTQLGYDSLHDSD